MIKPEESTPDVAQSMRYEILCITLKDMREEAISAKKSSGIEMIWAEDEEYYDGIDDSNRPDTMVKPVSADGRLTSKRSYNKNKNIGSSVFYNITSRYVNAATAHVADKLLPSDQSNYGLDPTPIPELIVQSKDQTPALDEAGQQMEMPVMDAQGNQTEQPHVVNGQQMVDQATGQPVMLPATKPATVGDMAKANMKKAAEACEKAKTQIDDWLNECGSNGHSRQVIYDAGKIGTGVLKGPFPEKVKHRAFVDGKMVYHEKIVPKNRRISAWNLYPDPSCGEDIHRGKFVFEADSINSRMLGELKKDESYLADAIDRVIKEGPIDPVTGTSKLDKKKDRSKNEEYQIWYFYGYLSRQDLEDCGHTFQDETPEEVGLVGSSEYAVDSTESEMPTEPTDHYDETADISEEDATQPEEQKEVDRTTQHPVFVVMVNDTIIKAMLSPLDSGRFPYQVMRWQYMPGTWAGIGVARIIRTAQDGVNASTRMLMDNAGVSARPIPIMNRRMIQPTDGVRWTLGPGSSFYTTNEYDGDDIRKAVTWIIPPSNQADLMNDIQFWMRAAEEVSGLPQLLQGQQGGVQQTRGEVQILNNNGNAVLRRITNIYDDDVTRHNINGFYEWLLLYGEDDSMKGDFTISARGASILIERDMQSQFLAQMLPHSLNPAFEVDPALWFKELLLAQRFDADKLRLSEEKKAEMAKRQPPPDPRVQAAQIEADTKLKLEELDDKDVADHALAQAQLALQQQKFDAYQADLNRALDKYMKDIDAQIAAAQLTGDQQMQADELKVALASLHMQLRVKMAERQKIEPIGRAPNGQAAQR